MSAPPRRRFNFSLRAFLLVVTILGVVLGWLGMQLKWIHDRHEALRWITDYRARQVAAESGSLVPLSRGEYVSHAGTKSPWSLRIVGEQGVERVEVYHEWLQPGARYSLNELRSLFPEAEVNAVTRRSERITGKERTIGAAD